MIIITTLRSLVFFIIFCSCVSCRLFQNDEEPKTELDKLPPATQTGENTFGCLVNGKAFVVTNTAYLVAVYQGGGLSISGGMEKKDNFQSIEILVAEELFINSTFDLINDTNHKGQFYNENSLCFYFTNADNQGVLNVSNFDPNNFIVSGTFQFRAVSDNCGDSVVVTNGRFDMQYIP